MKVNSVGMDQQLMDAIGTEASEASKTDRGSFITFSDELPDEIGAGHGFPPLQDEGVFE
jgi:hypothetical protein